MQRVALSMVMVMVVVVVVVVMMMMCFTVYLLSSSIVHPRATTTTDQSPQGPPTPVYAAPFDASPLSRRAVYSLMAS